MRAAFSSFSWCASSNTAMLQSTLLTVSTPALVCTHTYKHGKRYAYLSAEEFAQGTRGRANVISDRLCRPPATSANIATVLGRDPKLTRAHLHDLGDDIVRGQHDVDEAVAGPLEDRSDLLEVGRDNLHLKPTECAQMLGRQRRTRWENEEGRASAPEKWAKMRYA